MFLFQIPSVFYLLELHILSADHLKVLYTVTFKESGLTSGLTWYVNLSNGVKSGPITGSSYSFSLTNGSYSYIIATNNKIYHADGGSFQVNGIISNNDISVSFSKVLYSVTFTESNLPAGSRWTLLFNGNIYTITNTSYTFHVTNGSYTYNISTTDKIYHADGGSFKVNGSPVSENITFSKVLSTLTFTESNLPAGSSWTLLFNRNSYTLKNTSYTFHFTINLYFAIACVNFDLKDHELV